MDAVYRSEQGAGSARALLVAFIAGFLAVLVFHQAVLALLDAVGFVHATAYSMHAAKPFGVPRVLSLAFWGGLWGVAFHFAEKRFPRDAKYWIAAFLFGATFPTLVAWSVVALLKGQPVAAGWDHHGMITGVLINGAWGLGTALFLQLGSRIAPARRR